MSNPNLNYEFIISSIQKYVNKHNKLPTLRLRKDVLGFNPKAAATKFGSGSWNKLIIDAGFKPLRQDKIEIECLNCHNIFLDYEYRERKFCSRSCSISISNKTKPKRIKKQKHCITCNCEIHKRGKYCDEHNPNNVDWSTITYGELKTKMPNQNARIRSLSRTQYFSKNLNCQICGYDKHVEIHHIKPISTFSDDVFISEINDKSNIAILCPNCHWEAHNGLINL